MQNSRFHAIRSRFSPTGIRTSFRRASSASSRSTTSRNSFASNGSSPVETINSVLSRQPSFMEMQEEKRSFGPELNILEPRPVVYWGGLEERIGSF
ncbi:hypothetical protein JX265_006205 [Neoarthrinium moseri]|uniref:Calcium channel subunit cch1 n=1 Tax=Neoarthrinium moseri TaxID=1658444 RepID=A0A9Q0AQT3_9PEZI|nr:uncharacterized protein JN550_012724 [Neoarthrinium moseri]KAI1843379.1 hypothetical protein JX266_010376 [Neoarthrinium moseri]KAI1858359.1 hypothetical protein JN550_012724 [Neoarthrinium moseri]KAI1870035.1 hypothetical protein JX265_006205 [Neoarthrinium moseri]